MGRGSGFLKFRAAECGGIVAGFLEEITSEWIFRLAKNDEQGQNCSPRSCSDHVWRKKQILGIDLVETKKPDACIHGTRNKWTILSPSRILYNSCDVIQFHILSHLSFIILYFVREIKNSCLNFSKATNPLSFLQTCSKLRKFLDAT